MAKDLKAAHIEHHAFSNIIIRGYSLLDVHLVCRLFSTKDALVIIDHLINAHRQLTFFADEVNQRVECRNTLFFLASKLNALG